MGLNRWAKGVLDTPIEFYWPLPPLSYLPLMVIWLGIGEASKITLLTLAMFAPIMLSAQAGVRALPLERQAVKALTMQLYHPMSQLYVQQYYTDAMRRDIALKVSEALLQGRPGDKAAIAAASVSMPTRARRWSISPAIRWRLRRPSG